MADWWEMSLLTWFFWIFLCIAILAIVLWLVRVAPRPNPSQEAREDAEGTLRRRYLEGEIDEEEYERCLAKLQRPGEDTVKSGPEPSQE
jgi:uncharacterized membrane protein